MLADTDMGIGYLKKKMYQPSTGIESFLKLSYVPGLGIKAQG
jgi:hypothetical protein